MEKKVENKKLKEQHNASYEKKVDELKFNDKIDDAYTNSIIDKYKKGHKKNQWFNVSGSLTVLFGIICIVTMVIVGIIFASSSDRLRDLAIYDGYDYDSKKSLVTGLCIAIPIIGIFNILIGIKVCSFANYTREMLMAKGTKVVLMGCLQFLIGGFIISILTFVGYFVGRGIDYGAIYYNRIDGYNKKDNQREERYSVKELQAIKEDIFSDEDN